MYSISKFEVVSTFKPVVERLRNNEYEEVISQALKSFFDLSQHLYGSPCFLTDKEIHGLQKLM